MKKSNSETVSYQKAEEVILEAMESAFALYMAHFSFKMFDIENPGLGKVVIKEFMDFIYSRIEDPELSKIQGICASIFRERLEKILEEK